MKKVDLAQICAVNFLCIPHRQLAQSLTCELGAPAALSHPLIAGMGKHGGKLSHRKAALSGNLLLSYLWMHARSA